MSDISKKKEMVFYPDFLFREGIAAAIMVVAVIAVALLLPMKVGDPADPSDSSFKPRPEWYFMAPFLLLKLFPPSLEMVPTVIGPVLTIVILIALPFADRNPEQSPRKRPVAMVLMSAAVVLTVLFTVLGIVL